MATLTLPPNVIKNLGDRSYEKRKSAALEIEHIIKEANSAPNRSNEQIIQLITLLTNEYAYSTQSNHRKGGLIGLAATAIALMEDTHAYLNLLLPPVLKCFTDQESRVRYYACESMYNITKVTRGSVLQFFNEIFDGLCRLCSDMDADVKSGAQLLDRLMKDVVTESEAFDIAKFIPLLGERIKIKNPYIRQLLVGWITVLDSVPSLDMLEYIPEYLGGLFDMLSDTNKDIRQQSFACLSELLREITQTLLPEGAGNVNNINATLRQPISNALHSNIDLASMITILVTICHDTRDNFTKLIVLTWLNEFLIIGDPLILLRYVSDFLGVCFVSISDGEKEIRTKSEKTNEMLLILVQSITSDTQIQLTSIIEKITITLQTNKWVPSRLAALRWIAMLLSKFPGQLQKYIELDLFPVLLRTLQDVDDTVVKLDLEVLARICLNAQEQLDAKNFELVMMYLLNLFKTDRKFLEIRGSFIIRSLCELLDAEEIYRKWSDILSGECGMTATNASAASPSASSSTSPSLDQTVLAIASSSPSSDEIDYEFNSLMVQTLNLILLTSTELTSLRNRLKNCLQHQRIAGSTPEADRAGLELFQNLYKSWVHNPIATFSLCLFTQTYFLSSELIIRIAQVDISVNYLMQIDKLIQLLESPIYLHLRLKLLEEPTSENHILYLLKSLYGVLMLLPQSTAFQSLKIRLESVAPLVLLMKGVHEMNEKSSAATTSKDATPAKQAQNKSLEQAVSSSRHQISLESSLPIQSLLRHFEDVQGKHASKKQRTQKSMSLIKAKDSTAK